MARTKFTAKRVVEKGDRKFYNEVGLDVWVEHPDDIEPEDLKVNVFDHRLDDSLYCFPPYREDRNSGGRSGGRGRGSSSRTSRGSSRSSGRGSRRESNEPNWDDENDPDVPF